MSQKRYLQIANFDDQIHYKDKNPIWIKLYCSLVRDYDFGQLPDETKYHAIGLMILAAQLNNKFPEDEAWLRSKIQANSEINLNLLLEIGFLMPVKDTRKKMKSSFNACKFKKKKGNVSRALSQTGLDQNRTEQNKTEQNTTQHNTTHTEQNTTEQTRRGAANAVAEEENRGLSGGLEKPFENPLENHELPVSGVSANAQGGSAFSFEECLRYAQSVENVKNPQGAAAKFFKTGEADLSIELALYPERFAPDETTGSRVKFSDQPCGVCFGSLLKIVDGKVAGGCPHCRNSRGESTGFEPLKGN